MTQNPLNGAVNALLVDTISEHRGVAVAAGFLAGLDLGYRYPDFARLACGVMDNVHAREMGVPSEMAEEMRRAEGDDLLRRIREYDS